MGATIISLNDARRSLRAQAYAFLPDFQAVLATALCSRPTLFGRIGIHLEPSCIELVPARLAISAAKDMEHAVGMGPSNLLQALQWLRRLMDEGRCTSDEIASVNAMFDDATDRIGMLDDAAICALVVPVLKRRMQFDAATRMTAAITTRSDSFEPICDTLQKSLRVGETDLSIGFVANMTARDSVILERAARRTKATGILPLDDAMGGGLSEGTQTIFLGRSGSGKSMSLIHCTATFAMAGMHVAYATLELEPYVVYARLLANMTCIPINTVLDLGLTGVVKNRMDAVKQRGFGNISLRSFEARSATHLELIDWTNRIEQHSGKPVDCLVVDHLDKLAIPKSATTHYTNKYDAFEIITEGLRVWASSGKRWNLTATQAKREEKSGRGKHQPAMLTQEDVCDSLNKVRVADVVITINGTKVIDWYIAKNRHGEAELKVGPTHANFHVARIAPRVDRW